MAKKRRSGKRKLSVLEDYDQDGVPNFDDCRPLDPTMHAIRGGYTRSGSGFRYSYKGGRFSRGAVLGGTTGTSGTTTRPSMGRVYTYGGVYDPTKAPGTQYAVPFMQAGYTIAGVPSMAAKRIATFTKAARMPSQLTSSERKFIREYLPSLKPEYRRKFMQAEMKTKLAKQKLEIKLKKVPLSRLREVYEAETIKPKGIFKQQYLTEKAMRMDMPPMRTPKGYSTVYGTLIDTPLGEATYKITHDMVPSERGAYISDLAQLYQPLPIPKTIEPIAPYKKKEKEKRVYEREPRMEMPGVSMSLLYGAPGILESYKKIKTKMLQLPSQMTEMYAWGTAAPSERATISMLPSAIAQTKAFTKDVEAYETKWAPYVKDEYFTGTKQEYKQQLKHYESLKKEEAQLEKQYGAFTQLEASVPREKERAYGGVPAAYAREQERTAKWTKERVPSMKAVPVTWFERDKEWKRMFQEAAITQPEVFTPEQLANIQEPYKPPELPMWAERIFRGEQFVVDYQKGMIEGVREKPFETIATTAAFAAMPPVIKGLKSLGKATRMAPAMKEVKPWIPTISKIGKVTYPTFKRGEAIKIGVKGGLLPPMARHIPTVAGIGMGVPYAGMIGHELYTAPPGERAYTAGRISTTEILPIVAGTYIGMKTPAFMKETAKTLKYIATRTKMPMEKLTPEAVIAGRKEIVRIEKGVTPEEFLESIYGAKDVPLGYIRTYKHGIPKRYVGAKEFLKIQTRMGKLHMEIRDYPDVAPYGETLGMTLHGAIAKPTDPFWTSYGFVPGKFDPKKVQVLIKPGMTKAHYQAQLKVLLHDIKHGTKFEEGKTISDIPKYYADIFKGLDLDVEPTFRQAAFLFSRPTEKQVIGHELFHVRYPFASEEQVLGLEFKHALVHGKAKKMYPVGEEFEWGPKVWKAMPFDWGKKTAIRRGHFEMPGGYVSPVLQPFFLRMKPPKIKLSLFGEYPTPEMPGTPTAMRIALRELTRMPKDVLATKDPYSMSAWMLGKGKPGSAYVTWPIELGTKMESELAISPTTGMKWVPSPTGKEYYTTWKKHVVPIEHYEWFETGLPRITVGKTKARTYLKDGKLFEDPAKFYVERPRATAIIETPKGVVLHKGERGEGYILPGGGIESKAEVAARVGKKVKGESAADAAIREIYEELGTKTKSIEKLFDYEGEGVSVYARGRQKWYSRSIHDVFKMDILGEVKPTSREVSEVIHYKPGMKVKLSEDTQAILDMYFKGAKPTKRAKEVSADITEKVAKELMDATRVTPRYLKGVVDVKPREVKVPKSKADIALEEFFGEEPAAPKDPLYWHEQTKKYRGMDVDVRLDPKILDRLNKLYHEDLIGVCSGHKHPTEWGLPTEDFPVIWFRHPRAGRIGKRIEAFRDKPSTRIRTREDVVEIRGTRTSTPEWWERTTRMLEDIGTKRGRKGEVPPAMDISEMVPGMGFISKEMMQPMKISTILKAQQAALHRRPRAVVSMDMSMDATTITPQYMKDIIKGAKVREARIKRGEVHGFEEQLKYEEMQYADYYMKKPKQVGIVPLLAVGYAVRPPKEYKLSTYDFVPPTYGIVEPPSYGLPTRVKYAAPKTPTYKEPAIPDYGILKPVDYGIPKVPKYRIPTVPGYKIPSYETIGYKVPKVPKYKIPGYEIPELKIPDYEIPKVPKYELKPPPEITLQTPGEYKDKRRRRKKKYLFEEAPWREKHYIPTLKELMRVPETMKVSQPTAFTMKMPKMPKGLL